MKTVADIIRKGIKGKNRERAVAANLYDGRFKTKVYQDRKKVAKKNFCRTKIELD